MDHPERASGEVWNVGGGPSNAMSLAQLSRWCAEMFEEQAVQADGTPRPFDLPWVVMDNGKVEPAFGWKPTTPIVEILAGIAAHHRQNPTWLELSKNA
jgi:CDP-paratose 2-epimerase